MPVEVNIPYDLVDQVLAELDSRIQKAMGVARDVPSIIKERALLDNEDVNGEQMHAKKPRPVKNPTNFPEIALIQNESPDLMSPERWTIEQSSPTEITVRFTPPDHQKYLEEKAPENGGRNWLNSAAMNPAARAEIEQRMRECFE